MKITAYSTAMFSTWINVEEMNLLIDAGDGVTSGLLQKSGKIKHVFITHPDRDHLTGLLQFNQLNARKGYPKIYYPEHSGSFPSLQQFQTKFDPHVSLSEWTGIKDRDEIEIKKGYHIQAIRNEHIDCEIGIHKSLSYKLFESRKKLKPEFRQLDQKEIQALVMKHGNDYVSETVNRNLISFSGDTPVDDYAKWDGSEILIHESTFLSNESDAHIEAKGNQHSRIDEVFKMVSEINVQTLILNHFSSRYSKEQIDLAIRQKCAEYNIQIPVFAVYPGEIHRDILNQTALNA